MATIDWPLPVTWIPVPPTVIPDWTYRPWDYTAPIPVPEDDMDWKKIFTPIIKPWESVRGWQEERARRQAEELAAAARRIEENNRLQRERYEAALANAREIREQQRLRAKARNLSLRQRVTEAAPYYAMMKYKLQQWLPFHDCIRDRPGDDGPRLVFSDFLEEQGDCEAATFLRAHPLALPVDAPEFDIAPRARAWLTSGRTVHLRRYNLYELLCRTPNDLLSLTGFGVPCLMDTQEALEAVGLSLKMSTSGWERLKWVQAMLRPAVVRLYPNMEKTNGKP